MISMCVCVCEPKWLFYFVSFFFLSLMMIQLKRCINEFNDIMIIEMNVYKIHKYYLHTSRTMMKKEKKSPTGSWKTISINNNFEPFFFLITVNHRIVSNMTTTTMMMVMILAIISSSSPHKQVGQCWIFRFFLSEFNFSLRFRKKNSI